MSLTVNHNIMAMNANRNLGRRSKEDAKLAAVRELQRSDYGCLNQSLRVAQDAIDLIRTADQSLEVIGEKLVRMKELAVQATTGTYTEEQRAVIQAGFVSVRDEVKRVADAAEFNGISLLNPERRTSMPHDPDGRLKIHFGGGSSAEDYYYINLPDATPEALGLTNYQVDSQEAARNTLNGIDEAIMRKDAIRSTLGALQTRLEHTMTNLRVQSENLNAAESRVRDVDVAGEMTEFIRSQILNQSGPAMLAQANELPQSVMQLLGD